MCEISRRDALKNGLLMAGGLTLFNDAIAAPVSADKNPGNASQAFNAEPLNEMDQKYLKRSIEVADLGTKAENGTNHPYGAVIRFEDGSTMEAWNTVAKKGDPTRHAEMTLMSKIFDSGMHWQKDQDKLRKATIYTSAEPCFMCAGAIFWAGIGRVVYAVSAEQIDQIYKQYFPDTGNSQLPASAMGALATVGIDVRGPYLIEESAGLMHRVIKSRIGQDNPFKKQD